MFERLNSGIGWQWKVDLLSVGDQYPKYVVTMEEFREDANRGNVNLWLRIVSKKKRPKKARSMC